MYVLVQIGSVSSKCRGSQFDSEAHPSGECTKTCCIDETSQLTAVSRLDLKISHDTRQQDSATFGHDVDHVVQIGPVAAAHTTEMRRRAVSEVEAGQVETGSSDAGTRRTEAGTDDGGEMQPERLSKILWLLTQSTYPRLAETPLAGEMKRY